LHKYPAGGEANLSLVGKGGPDHDGQTLLQVHVFKHDPWILATQLSKYRTGILCIPYLLDQNTQVVAEQVFVYEKSSTNTTELKYKTRTGK